jgi:hypothetical protein
MFARLFVRHTVGICGEVVCVPFHSVLLSICVCRRADGGAALQVLVQPPEPALRVVRVCRACTLVTAVCDRFLAARVLFALFCLAMDALLKCRVCVRGGREQHLQVSSRSDSLLCVNTSFGIP